MKTYGDEGWISLLQDRMEKSRNRKIQTGSVLVDGQELVFAEREIVTGKLWMWLPQVFIKMPEQAAKKQYPDACRPQQIYTNQETTVNICFTLLADAIEYDREMAFAFRDDIAWYVGQRPGCTVLKESAAVQAGAAWVPWFEFAVEAEDARMYELMFFAVLKEEADDPGHTAGKLLLGAFHCLEQDMDDWKGIFVQMLASMRME